MDRIIETLARELGKEARHVENVARLLDEGDTVPFIARYRKELHGAMDDTALRTLEERLAYLRGLQERREAVRAAIEALHLVQLRRLCSHHNNRNLPALRIIPDLFNDTQAVFIRKHYVQYDKVGEFFLHTGIKILCTFKILNMIAAVF